MVNERGLLVSSKIDAESPSEARRLAIWNLPPGLSLRGIMRDPNFGPVTHTMRGQ